jgi:hypothetical protein
MLRYGRRMLRARPDADLYGCESGAAYDRSLRLLVRCLSKAQRDEFERSRSFTVRGRSGQPYRITYGTTSNVEVVTRSGKVVSRLCAGPTGLPTPAVMLAQKLMLETAESEFLRIAAQGPGTTGVWAVR